MLRVIIVPIGATGASSLTRELPQIIHLNWPNHTADKGLRGTVLDKLNTEDATYLSILKTILDKELAPFGKEVIVHTGGQTPNNSPYPRFTARFARGDAGPSTKAPKGY